MKSAWVFLSIGLFALVVTLTSIQGMNVRLEIKAPTKETPPSRLGLRAIFAKRSGAAANQDDAAPAEAAATPSGIGPGSDAPADAGDDPAPVPVPALVPLVPAGGGQGDAVDWENALKVGFLYFGQVGDYGFSYAQNQGRLAVGELPGVITIALENVPTGEQCLASVQELIEAGCTLIFAGSTSYQPAILQAARKNPSVKFLVCGGDTLRSNVGVYYGRMYQIRYLNGIVAGLMTKSNRIGFTAAYPVPDVVRDLNAFALGVKQSNPDAVIQLKWSNTWYDPARERELAGALMDGGCDVVTCHQDSAATQVAAEDRGVWCIGFNSSTAFLTPNTYLTGASWNWGPYMISQVEAVRNDTWKGLNFWGGIADDTVRMDILSPHVLTGTGAVVARARREIVRGRNVFSGPIRDNRGTLRVPEGEAMGDSDLRMMDWLVDNIREDHDQ